MGPDRGRGEMENRQGSSQNNSKKRGGPGGDGRRSRDPRGDLLWGEARDGGKTKTK